MIFVFPIAFLFTRFDNVTEIVWWTFPIAEFLTAIISVFILMNSYKKRIAPLETIKEEASESKTSANAPTVVEVV